MKKIFISFFALTIGLLWCSTTTAQNVLLNEDFESVELDKGDGSLSYNLPEGWTKIDADEDPAPQGSDQRHDGSYNGYLRFRPGRTRGTGYRPREVRRVNFLIFIRKEETACISCKQSLPFLYSIT